MSALGVKWDWTVGMPEEDEWDGVLRMGHGLILLLGKGEVEEQDQGEDQETVVALGHWEEPLLPQFVAAHEEAALVLRPPESRAPRGWGLWAVLGWADYSLLLHSQCLTS